MKKIKIPASIGAAEDRLAALDGIATATGWERAAIVYAFTYEGKPGPQISPDPVRSTIIGFVRLGIVGLKNQDSVRHCREVWKAAIASGHAEDIQPGDLVVLPTLPWPPEDGNKGSRVSADPAIAVKQLIAKHGEDVVASEMAETAPKAVAAQTAKPAVARAIAKQPTAARAVRQAARDEQQEQYEAARARSKMPQPGQFTPDPNPAPMSLLDLQILITEFTLNASKAEEAADANRALFDRMEQYLSDEQVDDLVEWAVSARDVWDMIRDYVASRGASDEALRKLLNQQP